MPQARSDTSRQKKRRAPPRAADPAPQPSRSGTVAIIGRPNVGKSTFLNVAIDQPLCIVSPTPQTTRDAILGVVHRNGAEIALLDTPGLHRPRSELGRVMNHAARDAARSADVVVFVAEVPTRRPRPTASGEARPLAPHPGDLTLLADVAADKPTLLVLNKVDRISDKGKLLPLLQAYAAVRPFASVVPISALKADGVLRVLDEVAPLLPEGPWRYDADEITDRPVRFFAAEYVREQILRATQAEVPHAVAIRIDRYVDPIVAEGKAGTVHIDATICVERPGQKRILIGTGGEMLKRIGTKARMRIEELAGGKVNLKLWVRVAPAWRNERKELEELGYSAPHREETTAMVAWPEAGELHEPAEDEEDTQ